LPLFAACARAPRRALQTGRPPSHKRSHENPTPAKKYCPLSLRQNIAFGAATAAYQVEGGWNAKGKGPSIWDRFVRPSEKGGCGCIAEGATGDVAADHYTRFQQDVDLMRSLGIRHYRFSISWPRLMPQGAKGTPVSKEGVAFYKALVKSLRQAGITPVATLYHWDLPHALQEKYGGFAAENPERFAEDFAAYADAAFGALSGGEAGVDEWITFNEPISICSLGYGIGIFAPGSMGGKAGEHKCGHALLLAHAAAAKVYNAKYRARSNGKGKLSIALDGKYGKPWSSNSPADKKAADAFTLFQFGWMADPLYFGDYPQEMRRAYDASSGAQLPAFTEKQKADLKASKPDALSLNFYTSYWVKAPDGGVIDAAGKIARAGKVPFNVTYGEGPGGAKIGPVAASGWLFVTPDAFGQTLEWLSKRYGSPEIWVTENGVSVEKEDTLVPPAVLRDSFRVNYFDKYLGAMCRVMAKADSKVRVTKYFAWSVSVAFFAGGFGWCWTGERNTRTTTLAKKTNPFPPFFPSSTPTNNNSSWTTWSGSTATQNGLASSGSTTNPAP
jgi:beta-glucosidase